MNYGIAFTPLVPTIVLWLALAAIVVIAIVLLLARARGAAVRVAALVLFLLALANPSFTREDRDPLTSVAAIVVDKSPSQNFGNRNREAATAQEALVDSLKKIKGLEVRVVDAGQADGETDGTKLFGALASALSDVPVDRVAGAFLITDGRVHDIPANAAGLGFQAPVHALITGQKDERDRRIAVIAAPRFGIVGQPQTITYRLDDQGVSGERAKVTVRRDGEVINERTLSSGQAASVDVDIKHSGPNVVEIEAEALADELTTANNRAVVAIDGVRDKLRVLLVSGEPHSGERTWRNLLKSDASVDLVHFTILRPPEKQDGTPINELSLIAFPTRELFQQKIKEFDLIIFDRYANQSVLPSTYFDNIVRYVREGGAVMVAAGPEFAGASSLARTRLSPIIPGTPDGRTVEEPYRARITTGGKRHPVTRELPGSEQNPPAWGEWLRLVGAQVRTGSAVMSGGGDQPLLVLAREDKGRVALLLSDHAWLWARGFRDGGPHLDLLRRLAHWLMKEPALEEEALRATAAGRDIHIERQTMAETADAVTLVGPSGTERTVALAEEKPGLFTAQIPARELGLHTLRSGDLVAFVSVGPANPRELTDVFSDTEALRGIAEATGGSVRRVAAEFGDGVVVPRIQAARSGTRFAGGDWIGIRQSDSAIVRGVSVFPLALGLLGLALLVGAALAAWLAGGGGAGLLTRCSSPPRCSGGPIRSDVARFTRRGRARSSPAPPAPRPRT